MKIKLDPWARMPMMAHPDDGGWDLYAPEDVCIMPGEVVTIRTGVHVQLPRATAGIIKSRSSMFRRGIITDGLIDRGYTGEIGVTLINVGKYDCQIHKGDRIAQLVIVGVMRSSWELVDELDPSTRGTGGFGSTGR